MDSATTTAAGEKPIIFQAIARVGRTMGLRNIWLIIRPTRQEGIFETFNDIGPPEDKERFGSALLGISSIFVKSSLYAVGGRKPNSYELSSCIRYLDTNKPFEGWKVDTLPFSSFDSVLGVYDDSIYILPGKWKYGYYGMDEDTYRREQRGYIWNTIDNECLQIRIRPPEDGGERQWRRIRACASSDKGLLIAMDGEKNNFFLYNPEKNDWEIYPTEDQLPEFIGETSFAASNGRLYILEVPSVSPAFLYVYDIKKRKLVMDKMPIPKFDEYLWSMNEWDRVVRLVSVVDDKLCFLWLGPVTHENEDMWRPVRILHYLKVKFSINPNPSNSEVKVEDDNGFRTNITNLLNCLPCSDPEQFEAELKDGSPLYHHLDAFQKQQTDNSSAEEIGTRLISGKQFQNQAKDIASPVEKVKRKRAQLANPSLSLHEQKRAKDREWRLKRKTQISIELKEKLEQSEKVNMVLRYEAQVTKAQLEAQVTKAQLEAKVREAQLEAEVRALEAAVREAKLELKLRETQLEVEVRALKAEEREAKLELKLRETQLEAEVRALKAEEREAIKAEVRKTELEPEVRALQAKVRALKAKVKKARVGERMKAELEADVREAEKQHVRVDKLQVLHRGKRGKNEEPRSTLQETVNPSKVPKLEHRNLAEAEKIELQNELLLQENASLKARMDELLKRSAELGGVEEKEQYTVGEKAEQYQMEERLKGETQIAELKEKLEEVEKDKRILPLEASEAELKAEASESQLQRIVRLFSTKYPGGGSKGS